LFDDVAVSGEQALTPVGPVTMLEQFVVV
jgi:hypothetical protein